MFFSNKSIIDASITPMHYFYQKNNIGKLHCDGGGGGGGGAKVQLNTPPRRIKKFKNQVCKVEAIILNWVYVQFQVST